MVERNTTVLNDALIEELSAHIDRMMRRFRVPSADRDDVRQSVLLVLCRVLEENFDPDRGNVFGYALPVINSQLIRWVRARQRRAPEVNDFDFDLIPDLDAEVTADEATRRIAITVELRDLPPSVMGLLREGAGTGELERSTRCRARQRLDGIVEAALSPS